MLFASTIGQIGHPFYVLFAWVLAEAYQFIPNYAIAIAILTIIVMIVVFPVTLRGTRGMMKMQLLAPEMKKLQAKYKAAPGMSVAERQEIRQRQQEEMMALYRENNVSPTGGCLPMLLQMPIFLILYGTIRGLIHKFPNGSPDPLYIAHGSKIYKAILDSHGALHAFGINLADSVRSSSVVGAAKIPFIALILVAIALQYIQMKQLSGRNPQAAAANPQMQQMQKVFPIVFAIIYISIPAGVNIYFIVSSLFRIGQQEFMYRRDPHIQEAMQKLRARSASTKVVDAKAVLDQPKGFMAKLAQLTGQSVPAAEAVAPAAPPPSVPRQQGGQSNRSRNQGTRSNGARKSQTNKSATPAPRAHPRSQAKRPRRAR